MSRWLFKWFSQFLKRMSTSKAKIGEWKNQK